MAPLPRASRMFLLLTCLLVSFSPGLQAAQTADPQIVGGVDISRWRGFNLLEKFTLGRNAPYVENDFRWIRELGFNFARLPIDYRCYTAKGDWLKFDEKALREIDDAIAYGRKHGVHVCLNLHRGPGFCINPPQEPTDLWTDEKTLEVFIAHWVMFARRYQDVPASVLSFNLLNEPLKCTRENYLKVFMRTIESIQKVDSKRLILVDGYKVGNEPSAEFLAFANVVQSTRGYHPSTISHYKASWIKGYEKHQPPVWPLRDQQGRPEEPADAPLKKYLKPWLEISAKGSPVFVGEWGCFNKTPHPVALAWMKSWLENWKQARFGWALWEFRGSFGILDSKRTDITYEDWHGHKLDRAMLTLLQQYRD